MNYNDAKEIYDEFIKETVKLQLEIQKLDNEIEKPFEKLYGLVDVESFSFEAITSFYEYRDKISLEFVKVVESHRLSVNDKYLYWYVSPFGNDYLPYMYDGELGSLLDILTEGELNFEFGDYYSVYDFDEYWNDFDEYWNEFDGTYDDIVMLFMERLSKINYIRNYKLPKINNFCEELREQFSVNALLEDCKKYISR